MTTVRAAKTHIVAIKQRLASLIEQTGFPNGVGNVLTKRLRHRNPAEFEEALRQDMYDRNTKQIRGWEVYLEAASDERGPGGAGSRIGQGRAQRDYVFKARGYMGYSEDDVEDLFDLMVMDVMGNLVANVMMEDVEGSNIFIGAPSVRTSIVEYGGDGVFMAEITIPAREWYTLPKGAGSLR